MLSRYHRTIITTTTTNSTMHRGELGELVKVLPVRRVPSMCHTIMPDDMSSVRSVRRAFVGGRMRFSGR